LTEAPSKPTRLAALTGPAAEALFAAAGLSSAAGDRKLAILDALGGIAFAAPEGLSLFRAATTDEIARKLTSGEGPTARRLRRLAATLPVGVPSRLERMRFTVERKSLILNLRLARIPGLAGGPVLVLFVPGERRSTRSAVLTSEVSPAPAETRTLGKARFLWALNAMGQFGEEDSALNAALGANTPRRGEALDDLLERARVENGGALALAVARRETFSDLVLIWPAASEGFRVRVRLSGAPMFGRAREFRGFRGFGLIDGDAFVAAEVLKSAADGPAKSGSLGDDPTEAAQAEVTPVTPVPPVEETEEGVALAPMAEADSGETALESPGTTAADRNDLDQSDSSIGVAEPPSLEAPPEKEAGEPAQPSNPPQERSAAIYILRQTASPGAAKVVPLRPSASEAAASPDPSHTDEAVELSKSERDAFREIARALVGRTPASRSDRLPRTNAADEAAQPQEPAESEEPAAKITPELDPSPADRNAAPILERLPIGVLVARDGRAVYLNHTLLTLLGYRDLAHFEAADGFGAMFANANPNAIPTHAAHALTIMRADGDPLAVDGHAQAATWDGEPATLIAFRRAVDDRRDEPATKTSEKNGAAHSGSAADLEAMLELATDGAVTLDSAGRILTLNSSAEALFGYTEPQVAGESVLMLLAPQSHPQTMARLENLSRSAEFVPERPLSVLGRRRDGAALTLALTLARLGPGDALHYCALMRDLGPARETERRLAAARDAAFAASSAKTDFLAQVSHEIRTPLHAILGFAEVMLEERFGPIGNERYKDYLNDIHTSGRHVMSLADDLLDLAKIEAGKLELAFSPVDANALIRECVSLMQPQAARERIIMRVSLADHMPRVMVDERSLRQILLNLMSNAVKFNEPGGQVIVSTAVDEGGQAVIRVRDTGVGMSESEIGHALEPFGQIGRRNKTGAGLGLPLTKALVEANKAEFSIKSQRDRGTLIEIAFPVAQAAQ